jgi:E3 ubiquitin-protein ligase TRIP12
VYDHKAYTEKSLGRLIKAKAKADRAAARHAQQTQMHALGVSTPSSSTTATPGPASETATPTPADSPHEADEPTPPSKESPDRTEMLRGKPDVVGRFMRLIVPILVDVYAASVITTVRIKTLTGLLKAISYLDADGIKRVLTVSRDSTRFFMQKINRIHIS